MLLKIVFFCFSFCFTVFFLSIIFFRFSHAAPESFLSIRLRNFLFAQLFHNSGEPRWVIGLIFSLRKLQRPPFSGHQLIVQQRGKKHFHHQAPSRERVNRILVHPSSFSKLMLLLYSQTLFSLSISFGALTNKTKKPLVYRRTEIRTLKMFR